VFNKEPVKHITKTCPVLEVSGVDIGGALEQIGAGGKSKQIRVPPGLFNAPEPIVAAFLRGYFEGDGYAGRDGGIMVRSVSKAMLEGVQQLLILFGIPAVVRNGSLDPRGYAPRHTLAILGDRSKQVFYERIGFLSQKKQRACQTLLSTSKKSAAEVLSLPASFDINTLKPAIYSAHRRSDGRTPMSVHVFASKLARGQRTITLPRAESVVDSLPDSIANQSAIFLHEAVSAQYYEVHVADIMHEAPVPMYDIAVDHVAQYTAQGIVVHNSNEPNLQNIPTRTDEGREVRRGFIAAPGHCFIAADYSQIELRVLAHITQDEKLVQTFAENEDIHAATASRLFGVPMSKVSKNQRRIAKCVAAGTLVSTEYGIMPIEQLGHAEVGEVGAIHCTIAQEGQGQQTATGFYNGGIQPTIRITTERGYVLEATAQHRVRSIDQDGNYVWKRLGELAAGEYAAIARGAMLFGTDRRFDISYTRRPGHKLRMPDQLTPAFARFLGYFVAEGNYRHGRTSSTVVISNADPLVIADLRQLSAEIFGALPAEVIDRNGVTSVQWHCSRLVELLEALGIESGAANKRIPDVIMQASYESVTEFLRAFYEGDGSISKSFISAASKSYTLIHQLQVLLLNFGIVSRIEPRDIPAYGRHYRLLLIGRDSRVRFAEHIGFVTERKHSRLRRLVERRATHEVIVVPAQHERLLRMYPKTKRELKETIHTCIRSKSPAIALTYRRLASIVERFPERDDADYQALVDHQRRDLFYDRIASIEHCRSQVFDLVVPATHTYIANGFVSHNTVVFGVIYGISAFGLAQRTDLSRSEAQQMIDGLFATYPALREYFNETLARGREWGYVQTLFGRRRPMADLRASGPRRAAAEREAINAPIQGTAADIMKLAMIEVDRKLRESGLRTRMLLQVHDELIFEAPEDEIDAAAALVCDAMEGAYELRVPLLVEVEKGTNWEEMEPVE
jgi:intein/homing endonuclease